LDAEHGPACEREHHRDRADGDEQSVQYALFVIHADIRGRLGFRWLSVRRHDGTHVNAKTCRRPAPIHVSAAAG
jgi:hypothetical protein